MRQHRGDVVLGIDKVIWCSRGRCSGRVSMNLKFIEGGKAGYKVVEFRGVGVA